MARRDVEDLERRIENLTERLLASFEELDFVHSLADVLSGSAGVEELDRYLLRETRRIFGADGGWMLRRGPEDLFETVVVDGFAATTADLITRVLVEDLASSEALPYLIDDLPKVLMRQRVGIGPQPVELPVGDLPRAFVAVPLRTRAETVGILCLAKRRPGDVFSSGDLRFLSSLAMLAATSIRNASLMLQLRAEARTLGRRLEQIEGDPRRVPDLTWIRGPSPVMRRLADQVEGAAAVEATVLLLGESGTGKSMVARILHRQSGRRDGPFVEINCGAVPQALIESELFGHARGSFTGAERDRPGLFEEAEEGSILLDEVAELPLESQVKLLTVLEQRRVRRVGENKDRPVRARVIAATNSDLALAVKEGRFREDLFYRLNVLTLNVPPLRQRREDVLPLARRFLQQLAAETHRHVQGFSPAAEEAILAYGWPGNVRELRNVVERALLLKAEGDWIEPGDLPIQAGSGRPALETHGVPLPEALRDHERALILGALHEADGVVSRASEILGISRTNLHNKLRKHGLLRQSQWSDAGHE